jgi:radical SAM superfamily enzyme YgiQ (UPF0313 family)
MKIILMSMPDVAPVMMHESAFHLPNCGIASIGANIDDGHEIFIVDLIRKRRSLTKYIRKILLNIRPTLVGLSAMTWQYETCLRLIHVIRHLLPEVKIVIGGYHATLMFEEIANSPEASLIDFMIRGEGEESFRRLINALDGNDRLNDIPSLSYKDQGHFIHNPKGELLDLSKLKIPIRDKRRLTFGYHAMVSKIEVMETSRGCTRTCSFCSMNHMYGQSFRTFPIEKILADIDDIYFNCNTRMIFIADDNMVLDSERVITICDAIISRNYKGLNFTVQADCISISRNEEMVSKMSMAGIKTIFLGIENVSRKNLMAVYKGDIVNASRKAVKLCHKYGIMVFAGMIFGFPDDDESDIIENYNFLKSLDAEFAYCQILTPYPKTKLRQQLMDLGMVTNLNDYKRYNGILANIRTQHLETEQLQYLVWLHRQKIIGWWEPSEQLKSQKTLWVFIWIYALRPLLKIIVGHKMTKLGWEGRFQLEMKNLAALNDFKD